MFAITTTSSTCGTSAGQRLGELLAVVVGDDDGGDLHACQHLQIDGDGAARGLLPREQSRAVEPRGDQPVARRRAPAARRPPAARARRRPRPRRPPRAAQHRARRRPASRRPSPRARAGRSPRSATAARGTRRRGRARRARPATRSRGARRPAPLELARELAVAHGPDDDERQAERREAAAAADQRVLALLDRAHQQQVLAGLPSPGENAGSTPCGVTVIFSGETPYSSTMSAFVRSDTASTCAARLAERGTTVLKTRRSCSGITDGSRSNERSWIVTTAGHGQRSGSACWKWASAGRSFASRRGTDHAMRSS